MASHPRKTVSEPVWTIKEADNYFAGSGILNQTVKSISARLDELKIPYVIVGGMALFQHGFRRLTTDVDILVRKEDLAKLHEKLEGRGYLPKFAGSKNLRDTQTGVTIEFLVSGEYPGDGKVKPVAFPDPKDVGVVIQGIRYLSLPKLIELKLSSGMTSPDRLKDIADVQQLIKAVELAKEYRDQLDPFVQDEFDRLWQIENRPRKFARLWRQPDPEELKVILAAGVELDSGTVDEGYVRLVTHDPELATRFDMHEESEFL